MGPVRDESGSSRMAPLYGKKSAAEAAMGFTNAGVAPDSTIGKNAIVMLITCLPAYLIVEIPALIFMNEDKATLDKDIGPFAWAGVAITFVLFVGYIAYQYKLANAEPASE